MVKVIITCIYWFLFLNINAQIYNNSIDLNISINQDTVLRGESIKLNLLFKNISDSCFSVYPKGIYILTTSQPGILGFPMRNLRDKCDYDIIIKLCPNETFKYALNVPIDNFFFKGKNYISISYIIYDKNFIVFNPTDKNLSQRERNEYNKRKRVNRKYWEKERGGIENAVLFNKKSQNQIILFVFDKL